MFSFYQVKEKRETVERDHQKLIDKMKEFQKVRLKEQKRLKNLAESTGSTTGSTGSGSSANQSEILDRESQELEKDRELLETSRESK